MGMQCNAEESKKIMQNVSNVKISQIFFCLFEYLFNVFWDHVINHDVYEKINDSVYVFMFVLRTTKHMFCLHFLLFI